MVKEVRNNFHPTPKITAFISQNCQTKSKPSAKKPNLNKNQPYSKTIGNLTSHRHRHTTRRSHHRPKTAHGIPIYASNTTCPTQIAIGHQKYLIPSPRCDCFNVSVSGDSALARWGYEVVTAEFFVVFVDEAYSYVVPFQKKVHV